MFESPRAKACTAASLIAGSLIAGCREHDAPPVSKRPVPAASADSLDAPLPERPVRPERSLESAAYLRWRAEIGEARPISDAWRRCLEAAVKERSRPEKPEPLTGDTELSEHLVLSLMENTGYYYERILELMPLVQRWQSKHGAYDSRPEDLTQAAFADCRALLQEPGYVKELERIYADKALDCRKISSTYFAALLGRVVHGQAAGPSFEMRLVRGICFDDEYAPKGRGHAWLEVQGRIVDPALSPGERLRMVDAPFEGYIPIAAHAAVVDLKAKSVRSKLVLYVDSQPKQAY